MPELRIGFDYHLAEAHRLPNERGVSSVPARYQARCEACGWVGPIRMSKGAAEDDAAAHDVTENE